MKSKSSMQSIKAMQQQLCPKSFIIHNIVNIVCLTFVELSDSVVCEDSYTLNSPVNIIMA